MALLVSFVFISVFFCFLPPYLYADPVFSKFEDVPKDNQDFCIHPCVNPEDLKDDSSASVYKEYRTVVHPTINVCKACYMDNVECEPEEEAQCNTADDGKNRKCFLLWGLNYQAPNCLCPGKEKGEFTTCNDTNTPQVVPSKLNERDPCRVPCPKDEDASYDEESGEDNDRYQTVPHPRRQDCLACVDSSKGCSQEKTATCSVFPGDVGKCVRILGVDIKDHSPECYCLVKSGLVSPPNHLVFCEHHFNNATQSDTLIMKVGQQAVGLQNKGRRNTDHKYDVNDLYVYRTAGGKFVLLEKDKQLSPGKIHLKTVEGHSLLDLLAKKQVHFFHNANELRDKTGFTLPLIHKSKWSHK